MRLYKKSKQARVPTFVCNLRDDASTAKGLGYDEGTNLCLRNFSVVQLMPTRVLATFWRSRLNSPCIICTVYPATLLKIINHDHPFDYPKR